MKPDNIMSGGVLFFEEQVEMRNQMNFGLGNGSFIFLLSAVAQWHVKTGASS
jgi:hypothetical protein